MKNILFIILIFPSIVQAQSENSKESYLQIIGLGTSINAVADEGVWGVNAFVEKDMVTWKYGRIYLGVGVFYGSFKVTNSSINQFTDGRATLI